MGLAIDDERTGAADAFPTIMIESDGFLPFADELLINHIEHLKE
jgi:hypothetical protein